VCEKSHPIVIGQMGAEYNQLGEVCESKNKIQREKICMGWEFFFRYSIFVHEEEVERKEESLELVHPWRDDIEHVCWSV
jgi:hypothetical protein